MKFRELLEGLIKKKSKQSKGYDVEATFSHISKVSGMRTLETYWFQTELDAIGYGDRQNKELEAVKEH